MLLDPAPRHALLLQGPVGPFFHRFAAELRARGGRVTKVNFNAADTLFYPGAEIHYREPMSAWPQFLEDLLDRTDREPIDAIYLFGDCRPLHREAVRIAERRHIDVWVFEEGYLRPDWVTLEQGGVNGHSSLPKDPDFYRRAVAELDEPETPLPNPGAYAWSAAYAIAYACTLTLTSWRYPHYEHHRPFDAVSQTPLWARGLVRKIVYERRERPILDQIQGEWAGRYYFVPLQVHNDAQLQHSPFATVEEFLAHVVKAFSRHARPEVRLVVKHHPQDRAYRDYTSYLARLGDEHGCGDRIVYVHDLHLPTILRHARGTITMNSTVGLSSLFHRTPVIALGDAVYDMPEMTFQGPLAKFLADPGEVDTELFEAFCRYLRHTNQVNGSFYKRLPGVRTPSGLRLGDSTISPPAAGPAPRPRLHRRP